MMVDNTWQTDRDYQGHCLALGIAPSKSHYQRVYVLAMTKQAAVDEREMDQS